MKTVFGIENKFQSSHLNSESTAAGQAVLRASKLHVFCHASVDLSRESTGTPQANLLSGVFTTTWFAQLWYREPRYASRKNPATNTNLLRRLLGYRC